MYVPTVELVLRPILTVTSVCNTRETGDKHNIFRGSKHKKLNGTGIEKLAANTV